jgi:hypothetical protein
VAGRATNLALLLLLPAAAVSGAATFLVGSGIVGLVVLAHGIVGLTLLALVPWKSVIIRRGLRRRRVDHIMSVILAASVLLALVSGLAHATGLLVGFDGVTALQVHVGSALVALVPLAVHVRRRRVRFRQSDLSRRNLLRAGLLLGTASVGYGVLHVAVAVLSLPGAKRRATGSYERSSGDPEGMPTTSWLVDTVPQIDSASWRVAVRSSGVQRDWSVEQMRVMGDQASVILDCTGGWWSRQEWSGVRLSRLLPAGSTGSVVVTSATGYRRRLPLTDDLLLAVDVSGSPLSAGHGAPVRLVVPGRRGYHWVKWVSRIEHDQLPWWAESPFPV